MWGRGQCQISDFISGINPRKLENPPYVRFGLCIEIKLTGFSAPLSMSKGIPETKRLAS